MNKTPPHQMPIMKAKCKTCPFGDNGCQEVKINVIGRILAEASQHCHGSGWPNATHLCRGARDFQLNYFHSIGFLSEPTDSAWDEKLIEAGIK